MAAKKSFHGQSGVSIEDAIGQAIASDPKGDQGTDIFTYNINSLKVSWGGIAEKTTYYVVLKR